MPLESNDGIIAYFAFKIKADETEMRGKPRFMSVYRAMRKSAADRMKQSWTLYSLPREAGG